MIPEILIRCKEACIRHEKRLGSLVLGLLALSLLLGLSRLAWLESRVTPIRIIGPADSSQQASLAGSLDLAASSKVRATIGKYVASKSGTRYYLPNCAGVSRIKEENKVWFATKEEAESRGLLPAANCKGI